MTRNLEARARDLEKLADTYGAAAAEADPRQSAHFQTLALQARAAAARILREVTAPPSIGCILSAEDARRYVKR